MKQLFNKIIGDKNISFLCLSIVFLILGLINPKVNIERDIHNYIFVVDISQSMLTKDMSIEGQKVSRLDYSKKLLQGIMDQLPCKTNVSIGMFAGVSVAATYTPINICDNYSAINSTIQHLDWRSVWSGNSRIREGLSNLARLIRSFPQSARVVFLTDGEEAPRLHTFNTRDLSQFQGETDWLMVGIGSEEGSAIPKYDSENQLIGFWSVDSFALQPGIAQISESNIGARNDSIAFSESDRYISKLNEKYLIEITSMIKGHYIKGDSVNSVISKMTIEHIEKAIECCQKLNSKYYSFHAGFLCDIKVSELGKKVEKKRMPTLFLHEIAHSMGAVFKCSPNVENGHIKGENNDLMNSNSNNVLDKKNDDYYDHEISDCPDLIDSVYFTPTSNTPYDPFEWACLKRDDWKLTNKKFKYEGNTCFLTDDYVSGPPKWLKNARKRDLDEY